MSDTTGEQPSPPCSESNIPPPPPPDVPEALPAGTISTEVRPKPEVICAKDLQIVCGPMTPQDYPAVRNLLPGVSRCQNVYDVADVAELLSPSTFHPFCGFRIDTGDLIAYGEIHRLPHLARKFDGRLEKIIVAESVRGMGVGTAFCQYLIQQARDHLNCSRLDLTAEKENARSVYTKLGFQVHPTETMRLTF